MQGSICNARGRHAGGVGGAMWVREERVAYALDA